MQFQKSFDLGHFFLYKNWQRCKTGYTCNELGLKMNDSMYRLHSCLRCNFVIFHYCLMVITIRKRRLAFAWLIDNYVFLTDYMKQGSKQNVFVLDLAMIKLICLLTMHRVLVAFLAMRALITYQCSKCRWTVLAQCQEFLSNAPSLPRWVGWGWARHHKGHSWNRWPQLTNGIVHVMSHHASAVRAQGKRVKKENICCSGICLSKQQLLVLRPSFPGSYVETLIIVKVQQEKKKKKVL